MECVTSCEVHSAYRNMQESRPWRSMALTSVPSHDSANGLFPAFLASAVPAQVRTTWSIVIFAAQCLVQVRD